MDKNLLPVLAQEIAEALSMELRGVQRDQPAGYDTIVDLLLNHLAAKVVALMKEEQVERDPGEPSTDTATETRLARAERSVEPLRIDDSDNGKDEQDAEDDDPPTIRLPNLKYAKPKYKNVESVLKYIEGDEDRGGLKLVIMNFND